MYSSVVEVKVFVPMVFSWVEEASEGFGIANKCAYIGRGPAAADSANTERTIKEWQQNDKTMRNRKISFVTQTFRVTAGPQKGDWVSLWGDCSFTDVATGKTAVFPIQYTAKVAEGKILGDRVYFDNLSVLQQLGYKLTPPEVAKK